MTIEEAIEALEILRILDAPGLSEAVHMAISALREQNQVKKLLQDNGFEGLEALLEDYSQVKGEQITRCKDCQRFDSEGICRYLKMRMYPESFCSHAERRQTEKESET